MQYKGEELRLTKMLESFECINKYTDREIQLIGIQQDPSPKATEETKQP